MDVVLLHNSNAGDEDHTEDKLVRLLKRHGYKASYASVDDGLDDEKLIKSSDIVIAAGGDGTVRKTALRLAGRKRPIAILPLGTANNIARSLGIGTDVNKIVASWRKARPRPIDLGVAKGPWGRTVFIEGMGVGLIGRAMAILERLDDRLDYEFPTAAAKLHRDTSVLAALAHEMQPVKARITIGQRKIKDEFLLLEILNISRAGPGVVLAPDADAGDGRFNLVSVRVDKREKLIERFARQFGGKGNGPRLHELVARKLTLSVDACDVRIDDKILLTPEDFRKLPDERAEIDVRIEPGAINVLG